jgi:hypothetical protein
MTWSHGVALHQAARLCELTLCDNLVLPLRRAWLRPQPRVPEPQVCMYGGIFVRFGSQADISQRNDNVRFGSKADSRIAKRHVRLAPIATAKADSWSRSCLLNPLKRTDAVQNEMSAMGQKQTHEASRQ